MAKTSETGHAKNVAFFDQLIAFIISFAAAYNPSKDSLKLPALQALLKAAQEAIDKINTLNSPYNNAVAAREAAFEPLSKHITRIYNSLKSSDSSVQIDKKVGSIVKKLQGTRAKAKKTPEELATAKAEGKKIKENSSSQMSFDNRINNLDKLIKLLASVPQYNPNEADLKVTALTAIHTDLKAKNKAVNDARTNLKDARMERNKLLYAPNTGLYDIAFDAKTYIKSLYTHGSPQSKAINKLKFKDDK